MFYLHPLRKQQRRQGALGAYRIFLYPLNKYAQGQGGYPCGQPVRVPMDAQQSFTALVAVAYSPTTHSILPSWLAALPVGAFVYKWRVRNAHGWGKKPGEI